jgi:uncharacterized protein
MSIPPHPGPPPTRPELPEGIAPPSGPPPRMVADGAGRDPRSALPPGPLWAPMPLAGLVVLLTAAALAAGPAAGGEEMTAPREGLWVGLLIQGAFILGVTCFLAWVSIKRLRASDFGLRRSRFWPAVGWSALLFVAFLVASLVYAAVLGIDESDDLAQQLGAGESTLSTIVVALLVVLVAPIVEEIFFRGFLFATLWRHLGWVAGAVISGLIFGFVHAGGTEWHFIPALAAFGFLLAALYRATGSILPCIGLHALNNGLALSVAMGWSVGEAAAVIVAGVVVSVGLVLPVSRAPRLPGT